LSYPLKFHEITKAETVFEDATFKVSCEPLDHRIACFGYRVEEADHPGELQADRLKALNIPSGPVYGQLKAGQTVTLPDGRTVNGQDFLGPAQKGRVVAILGDTRQTQNASRLTQDADVLVHESTFAKGESKLARSYYHSTNIQAAELAKRTHVKMLLLNHISARYTGKMAVELQQQAREIFKNTRVVKDFDLVTIPFQKMIPEDAK